MKEQISAMFHIISVIVRYIVPPLGWITCIVQFVKEQEEEKRVDFLTYWYYYPRAVTRHKAPVFTRSENSLFLAGLAYSSLWEKDLDLVGSLGLAAPFTPS